MPEFPHLPLPKLISAAHKPKVTPFERGIAETTLSNLQNRVAHGRGLKQATNRLNTDWARQYADRIDAGYPELPQENVIPIFLQVDVNLFDIETLQSFGIEIIAEETEGFIIGASADNFTSLKEKIEKFIRNEGKFKNKAAQLWNIINGNQWRIDYILSEELKAKWDQITDGEVLLIDMSVACYVKIPTPPEKKKNESNRTFNTRYNRWLQKKQDLEFRRFDLEEQRQADLDDFLTKLNAQRVSDFVGYDDSFSCRVSISGMALKDLVLNYQYLFDVSEFDELTYINYESGEEIDFEAEFTQPDDNAPKICIIDSGLQENHRLLRDAIDNINSKSYLPANNSVADEVPGGGHGTKVAGNILFGSSIPKTGNVKHQVWIQNARVLNERRELPSELFPPALMKRIVDDYEPTRVFNLSVNSLRPCKKVHMSEWGASIDYLSHEKKCLFIVSTGNIKSSNVVISNPGISEHLGSGRNYPSYLLSDASRIANPAQSCFALTVGSVGHIKFQTQDKESFCGKDEPSSFTRCGPGIWKMIKPDVVEYGGDFAKEKVANPLITTEPLCASEVVKTTGAGSNAIGYDIGTSFAAGKVSHIVSAILKEIPNASPNLIRTLIAQSARLPETIFREPTLDNIRMYGYGIANKVRATQNSARRITLTAESEIAAKQAEIYTLKIPDEIRRAGNDFDILIEVSVAYTAIPRRTRRRTRSYLSTWVDWTSSKLEETYNQFKARVTHYSEGDEIVDPVDDATNIRWRIRENTNWGTVQGLRRQDSSLQKDWVIMQAFQVPAQFSIAVVGHKGWEKDIQKKVPYAISVSFEVLGAEIPLYNLIQVENEIQVEQQVQV